jgi:argininosuccinate lyase
VLKGLPSGYNKDLQEDKALLFGAVDATLLVLPAVSGTIRDLSFQVERMAAAIDPSMMATDLADYMVERGATFREAHGAVGTLARMSEEKGIPLTAIGGETMRSTHKLLDDGAPAALLAVRSVGRREVEGGTGPRALAEQIATARSALRI